MRFYKDNGDISSNPNIFGQFNIVGSAGQLVVLGRKGDIPVVVIFQLDKLMVGQVGLPRVWVLDQMGDLCFSQCFLAVDKTSVTVAGWERPVWFKHLVLESK